MLALILLTALTASATDPQTSAIQKRARQLETQLIAPCCYRAPVSEHYSGAAEEVRLAIRAKIAEGLDDEQILQSFVDQHGERILSSPPAKGFTSLSYVLPVLALAIGAGCVGIFLWRNRVPPHQVPAGPPAGPSDEKYAQMLAKELSEE